MGCSSSLFESSRVARGSAGGGGRSEVGAYLGCLRGSGGGKRRPGDSRELKGAEGQAGFSTRN